MKYLYFYQLLYLLLFAAFMPFGVILLMCKKSFRQSLHQRLTLYTKYEKRALESVKNSVWIHASSVGEVKLVSRIPAFNNIKAVITTSTVTGRDLAKKLFPGCYAVLMPLDLVFLWKKFLKIARPSKLFIAETELWPALIFSSGMPKALFNARMSDEKYGTYAKLASLMKTLLREFDIIFARDKKNYERFLAAGADKKSLKLLGNLKYLGKKPFIDSSDPRFMTVEHPVITAGCTHEGEEEIIIKVVQRLRGRYPDISLIISPRHVNRAGSVKKLLRKNMIEGILWSEKKGPVCSGETIIVDSMGKLSAVYSLSSMVFVGGSFDSTGGHNVIEPAVWGKPVAVGPSYRNFMQEVEHFRLAGGLKVAMGELNLYNIFLEWLKDKKNCENAGAENLAAADKKRQQAYNLNKEIENFMGS